jgi:DNA-binding response OmpR family regulator
MSLIVIVEDNQQNARLAERVLRRAGFEVVIAEDGTDGLKTILSRKPDLVLMDLGLPDIDGQTVVAMLRKQHHLNDMPILAFTAWPEDAAQQMTRAYGFNGLISKPINTRALAAQVREHLPDNAPPQG